MRVPDHKIRELELRLFHDGKLEWVLVETQLLQDILLELKERRQRFDRDWERGYSEDYDDYDQQKTY